MNSVLLLILFIFCCVALFAFLLGVVIPISCKIGDFISDKVEDFLLSL